MAIHVTCQECGKTLRTKDSAAGRRAKCPACGAVIQIPEATPPEDVYDAEENPFGDLGDPDEWGEATDDIPMPGRKPCPMCGEMIKDSAAKCRYCGEIFDPALKRRAKKKAAANDVDADMTAGDWIVAILCTNIGCIAAIVWMIQGKPKGTKMLGVCLGLQALWFVVGFVLQILAEM